MDGSLAGGRRAAAHLVVLMIALLLGAGLTSVAEAAPKKAKKRAVAAKVSSSALGVNAGGDLWAMPADQRDRHLAAMRDAGLGVVRSDASWGAIQRSAPDANGVHRYDWRSTDERVAALARHGLAWYPVAAYSAPWAASQAGDPMSRPRDPLHYAAFARELAARYGSRGSFWAERPDVPRTPIPALEVWNEPNARMFWREQGDAPERFAELYLAARQAVRSVDTRVRVVSGGLLDAGAMAPTTFLRRAVAAQPTLAAALDAVGYHPYQGSAAGMRRGTKKLRALMDQLGMKRTPIEVTEMGSSYSEGAKAATTAALTKWLPTAGLRVQRVMPYVWTSTSADVTHTQWSLVQPDGTPKAAGTGFLDAVRRLLGR